MMIPFLLFVKNDEHYHHDGLRAIPVMIKPFTASRTLYVWAVIVMCHKPHPSVLLKALRWL